MRQSMETLKKKINQTLKVFKDELDNKFNKKMQIAMLESMLIDLLAPAIQPAIDELNAGNSFATLKVVL